MMWTPLSMKSSRSAGQISKAKVNMRFVKKKKIHLKDLKSSISYTTIYNNTVYNNKNLNVRKILMLLVNSYIEKSMPR